MSKVELSRSDEWELVHDSQDIRGWPVVDGSGKTVGTVKELIVDTDEERVTSLVLDTGATIPAREVHLGENVVSVGATPPREGETRGNAKPQDAGKEYHVPVVEEEIRIGKRTVERGGVRVETHVEEKPVEETVTLREERVTVDRNPVDRPATEEDIDAATRGTIEVTERNEEPVVDKRARVVEEVVVSKEVDERTETVRDKVRRTEVEVEKLGPEGRDADRPADR